MHRAVKSPEYAGRCVISALFDRDGSIEARVGQALIGQAVIGCASWASPKK
jgi:hypothetical protein